MSEEIQTSTIEEHKDEARARIRKAIRQNGQYTHNIIGMALSSLARATSNDAANDLIDEFNLEAQGFSKVEKPEGQEKGA